jgi:hypothetical protein
MPPAKDGYFCDGDANLDKEAVSIKKGALALADESGIQRRHCQIFFAVSSICVFLPF